jgi:hypothetical protein
MALPEMIPKELDVTIPPAIAKTYYLKGHQIEGPHLRGDVKMLWIWTTGEKCPGVKTHCDQQLHLTQRLD